MTSIKSFVSVLHMLNRKNTVEHISMGTALANALPYRSPLICLQRKRIINVETVLVRAQGYSISQVRMDGHGFCREANPTKGKMFGNSVCLDAFQVSDIVTFL